MEVPRDDLTPNALLMESANGFLKRDPERVNEFLKLMDSHCDFFNKSDIESYIYSLPSL